MIANLGVGWGHSIGGGARGVSWGGDLLTLNDTREQPCIEKQGMRLEVWLEWDKSGDAPLPDRSWGWRGHRDQTPVGHGRTNLAQFTWDWEVFQDPGLSVIKLGQSWTNQEGWPLELGSLGFSFFFCFSLSFSLSPPLYHPFFLFVY